MVDPHLVDALQSGQDRLGDLDELFFWKSLVFSGGEEVEEGAVGAVLHQDDHDLNVGSAIFEGD